MRHCASARCTPLARCPIRSADSRRSSVPGARCSSVLAIGESHQTRRTSTHSEGARTKWTPTPPTSTRFRRLGSIPSGPARPRSTSSRSTNGDIPEGSRTTPAHTRMTPMCPPCWSAVDPGVGHSCGGGVRPWDLGFTWHGCPTPQLDQDRFPATRIRFTRVWALTSTPLSMLSSASRLGA